MPEEEHVLIEEQHPIPQQISAFQFRLVGDMTLKQFVQLAGGAVIALLFYASGLPPLIKWPLIFFSFGGGAALAFLPLEDRPLANWVISFFKSIYSPTVFKWQKMTTAPKYFAPEVTTVPTTTPNTPAGNNLPTPKSTQKPEEVKLEEKEQSFLKSLTTMSQSPATTIVSGVSPINTQAPPTTTQSAKPYVVVPSTKAAPIDKDEKQRGFELPTKDKSSPSQFSTSVVSPLYGKATQISGKQASFSEEAAPPAPPTTPNTIVGQVMDKDGKMIIEGAILEIKDAQGRPVRALKTNKLGHFMIVTPLINGRYEMIIEKDGYEFEPIVFETKGDIILPILIKARG